MNTVNFEAEKETKNTLNVVNSFKRGVAFSESYILVRDELPSIKNGYVDELVLVCVRNKNKSDGIILWDICAFDGEQWSTRNEKSNTWEIIIGWRPIIRK